MAQLLPDGIRFLEDLEQWIIDHQIAAGLIVAIIAALGLKFESIVGFFKGLRKNQQRIEFELERTDPITGRETMSFAIKVANVEGRAASDVRYIWTRRSSCKMTPAPQPFMLTVGEPRRFEFTCRPVDLVTRRKDEKRLGWFELEYNPGSGRRKRIGRSVIVSGQAEIPIDLAPLPPKSLDDYIPLLRRWNEKSLRDRDIRNFTKWLQDSRAYLEARGIPVNLIANEETLHRLLGELGGRGWAWDFAPGGRGYEVHAEKAWPPSSSMSIRFSADTALDAATLVLASAIQEDEDRSAS